MANCCEDSSWGTIFTCGFSISATDADAETVIQQAER
jgi:hypothetical protein